MSPRIIPNFNRFPDEVTIGNQTWKTQNLNVDRFRDGRPIRHATSLYKWNNIKEPAWCYYMDDSANEAVYGKLYNWYAVNYKYKLAPEGWHIPSSSEWETLVKASGPNAGSIDVAGRGGIYLKEAGNFHWEQGSADNRTGFTALPGGCRGFPNSNGPEPPASVFADIGTMGYYWACDIYTNPDRLQGLPWSVLFYDNQAKVGFWPMPKYWGYSVRLVKD